MSHGNRHDGFPEKCLAYSFTLGQMVWNADCSAELMRETSNRINDYKSSLQATYNLKKNALFSVYPKGGYISWHNNANASAYNFIFTYSETGDGWWQHWDMKQNKLVEIPDKKGWQCKAGYFGAYSEEKERLVYHAARTFNSRRMTVAFTLDRTEMSQGLQEWIIEDIHA